MSLTVRLNDTREGREQEYLPARARLSHFAVQTDSVAI
jgi:hypothetical protein